MRSPLIVRIAWGEIEVEGFGRFKDAKLFPGGARGCRTLQRPLRIAGRRCAAPLDLLRRLAAAESNGHGWESLAWWLTHTEMPDLADPIRFGSESGTFVAASSDPAALRRLAERLHAAFHDRSLLARLIGEADM